MTQLLTLIASLALADTTPVTPAASGNFGVVKSSGQVVIQSTSSTVNFKIFDVRDRAGTSLLAVNQAGNISLSSFTSISTGTFDVLGVKGPSTFGTQAGTTTFVGGVGGITSVSSMTILGTGASAGVLAVKSLASSNPTDNLNFLNNAGTVVWQIGANSAVSGSGLEFNNADGSANRMYLTTGGNLGIGTTNPGSKLEVQNSAVSGPSVRVDNAHATSANAILVVGNSAVTKGIQLLADVNGNGSQDATLESIGTGPLYFDVNGVGTHVMTLLNGGNVGINTTSPASKLHMSSGTLTVDGNTAYSVNTGSSSQYGSYTLYNASATIQTSGAADAAMALLGGTGKNGYFTLGANNAAATVTLGAEGAAGSLIAGSAIGDLSFRTNSKAMNFSTNNGSNLHMALSGGNLGLGTANPGTKLHLSSQTLTIDGAAGTLKLGDGTNAGTETLIGTGTVSGNWTARTLITKGAAPTASANCTVGTGSSDMAGTVAISGGATNACTITWNTNYANTPFCVATDQTANTALKTTPAVGSLIVTLPAAANDTIAWFCVGN